MTIEKAYYTIKYEIQADRAEQWLGWMSNNFVEDTLALGLFSAASILLEKNGNQEKADAVLYEVRYTAASIKKIDEYVSGGLELEREKEYAKKYGDVTKNVTRAISSELRTWIVDT